MEPISRSDFVRKSTVLAGGALIAPAYIKGMVSDSPNDRVNVALIGIAGERPNVRGIIDGRGIAHINSYAAIPNVRIKTICDVDERLFPGNIRIITEKFGAAPEAEFDYRKVLEDKDIDVISLLPPIIGMHS
jgi:hypothetical protein